MWKSMLLAACLLFALPFCAYADVLVEPNNNFYTRHREECTYLGRSFYANGEQGFVSIKEQPGAKKEVLSIENGEIIHIMFTYNYKGDMWGVTEIYTADKPFDKWPNGWLPMDDLLPVYDYLCFAEDYQEELYTYTGSYDMLYEVEDIIFWTWPGSGEQAWILEKDWRNEETDRSFLQAAYAYKDAEGREWGFMSYVYGRKNSWVCLSDPANPDIPAINPPPPPQLWTADNTDTAAKGLPVPLLSIALVILAAGSAGLLIRLFWQRN